MFRASFVGEIDGNSVEWKDLVKEDDDGSDANNHQHEEEHDAPVTSTNFLSRFSNKVTDINFKFDRLLKKYELWLDENPIRSRCILGALTAAIGAMIGARHSTTATNSNFPRAGQSKQTPSNWTQILAFAIHGGLVAGPLSYYVDNFLEDNFFDSRSSAMLFDQILATPPQLFLTFFTVHLSKAALEAVPSAAHKSWSLLASTTADAWKFWPISIYILLKLVKKRRQYAAAINLWSIAWAAHLAKKYSARPQLTPNPVH